MNKILISFTILLVSVFLVKPVNADDFSEAIMKAKKHYGEAFDKNDMSSIPKIRGEFERILQLKKNQWLVNYYLADIDFMLSYNAIEKKDNDAVKKYTESALELLDKSTDMKDDFAEAYILKMAVQSNRWMYEMDKMNDIIAKQTEAKDKAKQLEPENPRFYLIDGMNTYYTPESFGGGVDASLPMFTKSFEYFQTFKPKDETMPSWGHEMAAGMMSLCYMKKDKMDEAKKYLDKALEINPNSGFVKENVQKEYDKKTNNK
jgi:tetratricopeptide (TPR) repeat protein